MGVEEEYLLVGPDGVPASVAGAALKAVVVPPGSSQELGPGGDVQAELQEEQLETGTRPCTDLSDLAREVREGRARAQRAAASAGASIAALATAPVHARSVLSPNPRYEEMSRQLGLTAREQLTCGCHVHVQIADDEEGVAVIDRIAPWLPVLLALSGNSPFWHGEDTAYASFRSQVWNRWPTAGPVAPFGSAAAYHRTVDELIATRTILDAGMIYFDARLSARYPTIEVRVADVCLDPDDTVLLAALVRALVETCAREAADGVPATPRRVVQLRAATWRAGRSGLAEDLVSPLTFLPVPAWQAVQELVTHVTPALTGTGDLDRVQGHLDRLRARGTGADRQRAWLASTGRLADVVGRAVEVTLG